MWRMATGLDNADLDPSTQIAPLPSPGQNSMFLDIYEKNRIFKGKSIFLPCLTLVNSLRTDAHGLSAWNSLCLDYKFIFGRDIKVESFKIDTKVRPKGIQKSELDNVKKWHFTPT